MRFHPQAESKWHEDYSGQFGGRDLVARGDAKMGLTDSDDVNVAPEENRPVVMASPDRDGTGGATGLRPAASLADSRHVAFIRAEVHHRLEETRVESYTPVKLVERFEPLFRPLAQVDLALQLFARFLTLILNHCDH
jgi:hypothetical protein